MLRRTAVVLGIVAVMSIATGTARAQPSVTPPGSYAPPPMSSPATTHTERYGKSIAAVDALAVGLELVGVLFIVSAIDGGDDDAVALGAVLLIGGAVCYVGCAPYIHTRHHNNSSAWKSVSLRLGLPLLGSLIGGAMAENDEPDEYGYTEEDDGSLAGLGVLAAMVIDWVVLAKVEVPDAPQAYAMPVSGGGATFGLGGRF